MVTQDLCKMFVKKSTFEIAKWTIGILFVVGGGVQTYLLGQISLNGRNLADIDKRLVAIEASRFTSEDGKELFRMIGELKADVAALPKVIPPQWFKDVVFQNKKNIDSVLNGTRKFKNNEQY